MINKQIQAINDSLYGFIHPSSVLISSLISHPFFQRLRRIKQLGLIDYVYPGATHNRFQHALGAMHLGSKTVVNLRKKGVKICDEEKEALEIALLLHDIGHGPFSHTLERLFFKNTSHEQITLMLMQMLVDDFGNQFGNQLQMAISIFKNTYKRKFFHQLVSSQIDLDRIDYLQRDSFYSGIADGNIGGAHILNMFSVFDEELVIDEKGIYSVESFLSARRLMAWQVYMHKTAIAAEKTLINIIKRVVHLVHEKNYQEHLSLISTSLSYFFQKQRITLNNKLNNKNKTLLKHFSMIDDSDIICALKLWSESNDFVLATLSKKFLNRDFFRCQISITPANQLQIDNINSFLSEKYKTNLEENNFFYAKGVLSHHAYNTEENMIKIITKEGVLKDIADISDLPNIKNMHTIVKKHYLCWPK